MSPNEIVLLSLDLLQNCSFGSFLCKTISSVKLVPHPLVYLSSQTYSENKTPGLLAKILPLFSLAAFIISIRSVVVYSAVPLYGIVMSDAWLHSTAGVCKEILILG